MSGAIKKLGDIYVSEIERSVRYIRPHITNILSITAVAIPLFYVFDLAFDPTFDTLGFRIVGGLVCLIPIYLIKSKASEMSIAISTTLTASFCLVWMFPAMLMVNAASVEPGGTMHYAWICMYLIAIFLYIQLISNFLVSLTGWALGFLGASMCLLLVDNPNMDSVLRNVIYPFSLYVTALVFGNLLNRHVEAVEKTKTEAAKAIGGNIAHELRTPLSGINARAKALAKLIPEFTEAYEKATDLGLVENPLPQKQIDLIRDSASDISAEATYSNSVINMLLINTAEENFGDIALDVFYPEQVMNDVLNRYPFPNKTERAMVGIVGEMCESTIKAPKLLVEHILFNLLKNALFYCQHDGNGSIEMSARNSENGVQLVVRDTGPGIPTDIIPKIFDRFFTTSPMGRGSGIGLNFCKNVMRDLGGSIRCTSVLGEFTEFVVEFPNNV